MDAAGERCRLQPLVLLAEHPHFVAGARRDRAGRLGHMAGIGWCVAVWRLHRRGGPIRALLYRHHHQPLPMIVPHHYTLMQAASPPGTQAFLLVGTLFLLPVILFYSGWSYWV